MQNVVKNEWKRRISAQKDSKNNAKCCPKIMQNIVKNEWKVWSKNNAKCSQEWMKTEKPMQNVL